MGLSFFCLSRSGVFRLNREMFPCNSKQKLPIKKFKSQWCDLPSVLVPSLLWCDSNDVALPTQHQQRWEGGCWRKPFWFLSSLSSFGICMLLSLADFLSALYTHKIAKGHSIKLLCWFRPSPWLPHTIEFWRRGNKDQLAWIGMGCNLGNTPPKKVFWGDVFPNFKLIFY